MSITNTWNIVAINCKPGVNGMLDYVVVAHWTLSGTDGTYTGSVYGTASFEVDPDKPNYTPYEDLTLDDIKGPAGLQALARRGLAMFSSDNRWRITRKGKESIS